MSAENPYCGVVVPMVTPFTPSGAIDEPAVGRIVEHLIAGGIGGVFALGTTGESASIHPDDQCRLAAATIGAVGRRARVYCGISGNSFRQSLESAAAWEKLGADAVVAHVPSYYPLSDAEIEAYFLRLADEVKLPLVLYNIPVTTHHSIPLAAIDRLRGHPNIVALKDSAGDPARITELLRCTGGRGGFPVLLGNSVQFTHGLQCGGVGMIPSGGHLVPELYQAMYQAAMADQWPRVKELQSQTDQVCQRYLKGRTLGQGLAALKALLEERGLCGRTMLPPLREHSGAVA